MIRKTLLFCWGLVSAALLTVSACSSNASAEITSNIAKEESSIAEQAKLSIWESDLCSDSRFQLNIVPTKEERRIANKFKRTFEHNIKNADPFLHYLLTELKVRNLPAELVAIPLIESGFNTKAKSYGGAHGVWQFVRSTGKSLGLKRTQNYDELYDYVEATDASLAYFKRLYNRFGNWDLVFAAYNQGEYGVNKAIEAAKARGVKDLTIYNVNISGSAKSYVKRFHAFADMLRNPARYGIKMPEIKNRPAFKRVQIAGRLDSMKKAAQLSGVEVDTLKRLNAGFLTDSLKTKGDHMLLVPVEHARTLENALEADSTASVNKINTEAMNSTGI